MKRFVIFMVMVMVLVGAMAGSAFATRYDSGYAPFTGVSPHGGYSTATNKCAVCHAVHNPGNISALTAGQKSDEVARDGALNGSEALLRADIANACTYCHITGGFAIKTVYNESIALYTAPNTNAHTTNGAPMSDVGVRCTDCHQVHGALASMVTSGTSGADDLYLQRKILKYNTPDPDAPVYVANSAAAVNPMNMTRWCSGCHTYYEAGYNGNSHVMKAAAGAYSNPKASIGGTVAWSSSTYCRSCHQDGLTDQLAAANGMNDFPHYTAGFRFLKQANSSVAGAVPATSQNDGLCLICHTNGVTGAGITF